MDVIGRVQFMLRCPLSTQEQADRLVSLLQATQGRRQAEDELEEWKASKAAELKQRQAELMHLGAECARLAHVLHEREELRQVECSLNLDGTQLVTVRLDTGEVVSARPATPDELQTTLPVMDDSLDIGEEDQP